MHMSSIRVAVAGCQWVRRGRAAASAPGAPARRDRRAHRRQQRRREARVPPAAPDAAGRPGARRRPRPRPWPTTTSCSWRCRTAQSAVVAAELPEQTRGHRLRRRLPAQGRRRSGRPSTAASTPAPGPTASPSCRVSATPLRGARRIAVPGCYPTVASLAAGARGRGRAGGAGRRGGRRVRHQRRRQGCRSRTCSAAR